MKQKIEDFIEQYGHPEGWEYWSLFADHLQLTRHEAKTMYYKYIYGYTLED